MRLAKISWRAITLLFVGVALLVSGGVAFTFVTLLPPSRTITLGERLAEFPRHDLPLAGAARIHWSTHGIPFIKATVQSDIPLLLGMVHAHLRLGQMEILRRVSQGRLSEMGGPLLIDIDRSLRVLGLSRAASMIEQNLPADTRAWLDRYVEGINLYLSRIKHLPPEWTLLGLERERWTVRDVVALTRLVATDVNWLFWARFLKLSRLPAWPEVWGRLRRYGEASGVSMPAGSYAPFQLLGDLSKGGSNAFAISASRAQSNGAMLASDPHVGLSVPPLWCVVSWGSPGGAALGLSIPGVPLILVGRNRDIAWGGTNLLSASSVLFDLSEVNETALSPISEEIRVRWWPDTEVHYRDSPLGPVISDAPALADLAEGPLSLWWQGYRPSDEITTFLQVQGASTWDEFRSAFKSYAVSGQNFLFAGARGDIGQIIAMRYAPAISRDYPRFGAPVHEVTRTLESLREEYAATELPSVHNPAQGFLVSTNNLPIALDPPLSYLANSSDRFERVSTYLRKKERVELADLQGLQRDVYSDESLKLARTLIGRLEGALDDRPTADSELGRAIEDLRAWDGRYESASRGAAVFQMLLYHFATRYYRERYGAETATYLLSSTALYTFAREDLESDRSAEVGRLVVDAAIAVINELNRDATWGALHRLEIKHLLGNLPLIGRAFRYGSHPVGGSSLTLMKSAHSVTNQVHTARYGANARFIADMGELDGNYVALLGGNDGWLGSEQFLDQLPLWERGDYLQAPLSEEGVLRSSPYLVELSRD